MQVDLDDFIVILISQAAGMAAAGAGMALGECLFDADGRSSRSASTRKFAIRRSQFQTALENHAFDDGWFFYQFRCNRASFEYILDLINGFCLDSNDAIDEKACFFIRDRAAVTIHYLAHSFVWSRQPLLYLEFKVYVCWMGGHVCA